jgi:hypothetical protein
MLNTLAAHFENTRHLPNTLFSCQLPFNPVWAMTNKLQIYTVNLLCVCTGRNRGLACLMWRPVRRGGAGRSEVGGAGADKPLSSPAAVEKRQRSSHPTWRVCHQQTVFVFVPVVTDLGSGSGADSQCWLLPLCVERQKILNPWGAGSWDGSTLDGSSRDGLSRDGTSK